MLQTSKEIRNPGLRTLPPGVERFFVKGGGLSIIEVSPEDKIEIINDEGKQICEIIVFNSEGKSNLSILDLKLINLVYPEYQIQLFHKFVFLHH